MKVIFKKLMLVLLAGTLLAGTFGTVYGSNAVNRGRMYCPADGEFYTKAGSHKGHVRKSVSHTPKVARRESVDQETERQVREPRHENRSRRYLSDRNNYRGGYNSYSRSPVDIDIWVNRYQYPTSYTYLADPYGQYYGHNTSTLYNLGGHNVLRDWFGGSRRSNNHDGGSRYNRH